MGCEALPIHAQFYRPAIWTSKVGQGDLVFDVRSGFASGSVRARLQIFVYSGYDFCHSLRRKTGSKIATYVTFGHLISLRVSCNEFRSPALVDDN